MKKLRLIAMFALALTALAVVSPAVAGDAEVAALKAVLAPGPVDTSLFDAAFLKAVPAEKIQAGIMPLKALIGPVLSVASRGGPSYTIETATHEIAADITLDTAGKIGGLVFHNPIAKHASLDDLLGQFGTFAPQSAWVIEKNGAVLRSSNPQMPLAVGSAFKLGILKALKDDIDTGRRKWDDVVRLAASHKSLPTGMLQGWPDGSPLTLHTLAALMVSISDNTATDTLLDVVGRDRVEAALGIAPVLTTRELFILKANPELLAKYKNGNLAARRAAIVEADEMPLPPVGKVMTVHTPGVEWELSPGKLCSLMTEVGGLDVAQINPGIADPAQWSSIAYKGGSETGVLSLTTLAGARNGDRYCVSAVWNADSAIDEAGAEAAYGGVLAKLAGQ